MNAAVNDKHACVSRVSVTWLVSEPAERMAAMMFGDVSVALQNREWLDLSDAQRAAIVEASNHCLLINAIYGNAYDSVDSDALAIAWTRSTTSCRMGILLLGGMAVDLFELQWLDLQAHQRRLIIERVNSSSLLHVLRAVNFDLFKPDLPLSQRELNLGTAVADPA